MTIISVFSIFVFPAIVAVSTLVYTIYTKKLVNENKMLRDEQYKPDIFIYLEENKEELNLVEFVIENVGQGPAFNISFVINNDSNLFIGGPLSDYEFVKKGMSLLAPMKRKDFTILELVNNKTEKSKIEATVIIEYIDKINRTYKKSFILKPIELEGFSKMGGEQTRAILKDIRSELKSIGEILLKNYK